MINIFQYFFFFFPLLCGDLWIYFTHCTFLFRNDHFRYALIEESTVEVIRVYLELEDFLLDHMYIKCTRAHRNGERALSRSRSKYTAQTAYTVSSVAVIPFSLSFSTHQAQDDDELSNAEHHQKYTPNFSLSHFRLNWPATQKAIRLFSNRITNFSPQLTHQKFQQNTDCLLTLNAFGHW